MKRKTRKETGITLTVLVVTIIVLLIVVGITIGYVAGDNPVFRLSQESKNKTDEVEQGKQEYQNDIRNMLDPILPWDEVEPTGIYVVLVGNTLRFYTTESSAEASGGKVYEYNNKRNMQGQTFTRDNVAEVPTIPWYEDREKIRAAEFVDEVAPEYMAYFFSDLEYLETVDMTKVKTSNVTDMYGMFLNCRSLKEVATVAFDTRKVENMGWMFLNCEVLTELDMTNFDTRNVKNMAAMFSGCGGLTYLDVSNFDTSNVESMGSMFAHLNLTRLDLSNFDTSKVTNMKTMFYNCKNLKELDLSNFDTSQVTTMAQMFNLCSSIETINLSSFNTSNVKSMESMFQNTNKLKMLDLSKFNVSSDCKYYAMFTYNAASFKIITNQTMKTWLNSKFSNLKNIEVI